MFNSGQFQPGNNEGQGRPPGAVNKRSEQLRIRLKERGDVDPADFCSSIVSNPNEPTELKLQAANYLLPYLYSKRGAVTPPRYIEESLDPNSLTSLMPKHSSPRSLYSARKVISIFNPPRNCPVS